MTNSETNSADSGPAFPIAEYESRLERLRAEMHNQGWAAVICAAPETLLYFTGHEAHTHFSEQALVILANSEPPTLVLRDTDVEVSRETSWVNDIRTYRLGAQDPADLIKARLSESKLESKRVGLEMQTHCLPMAYGKRIALRLAPSLQLEDSSIPVGRLRVVKSDLELRYVREAAANCRHGIEAARRATRAGASEFEVAAEISHALQRHGSEYSAMPPWVASGVRTSYGHAMPTARTIRRGEPVSVSFASVRRRYHVSIYHTIHVDKPSAALAKKHSAAREAQETLINAVRIGVPVREASMAARATLRAHRLEKFMTMRWGYGVGIGFPPTWLEPLDITEESEEVFKPGMMFCLHASMYFPEDGFGFTVGGDYLLTSSGIEALDPDPAGLDLAIV